LLGREWLRPGGTMKTTLLIITSSALLFSATNAAAEPKLGFRYWHGDLGLGLRGGGGARVVDGQLYAGAFLARQIQVPGWSPFVGLGIHLGAGEVRVDDPRGIDGVVFVNRFDVGPEFRFGVTRGDKIDTFRRAWPHVQLYGTTAFTSVHAGIVSTELPEAGHSWAVRLGAGMSFPIFWSYIQSKDPVTWLFALFPNTYAFDMEVPLDDPNRPRFGIRFGFGI
jgi:hypothetical protein